MSTYQLNPTYFRITWDNTSPTNYSVVNFGGITPLTSLQYKDSVVLTGNVNGPSMSTGDTLFLNNVEIGPFDSGDTVSDIVNRFNLMLPNTGVMASENWTGYVTLQSMKPTSAAILLEEGVGTPCADIGLPTGTFGLTNPTYGGSFTTLTNGQSIILNGVTITFVTGGLDVAGAVAKINSFTGVTDVVATPWTDKIQLNSLDGSPIYFGAPGSGTATANLGFAINTAYGGQMYLQLAENIEKGNMRWKGIISSLSSSLTAYSYGVTVMTGSTTDGAQLPETVSWTLGVENPDSVYCITASNEPEGAGEVLTGTTAVKRLVARALVTDWSENRNVFNPGITVRGTLACRENPVIVENLTALALDTVGDIATIEDNITVALIPYA
jgi:hypothetical protein